MVELIGWKRFELNKLMKFAGCDETNWWSTMCLSLVIQFRGRFVNPTKIQERGGPVNAAKNGFFLLDNNLKDFVQSRAAGACLFKLVRGCMAEVSSSDMLQFLDDYVNGLDDNFTFHKIREACCLPNDPPKPTVELKRANSGTSVGVSSTQDGPNVASTPTVTVARDGSTPDGCPTVAILQHSE